MTQCDACFANEAPLRKIDNHYEYLCRGCYKEALDRIGQE